ncbi:LysM peptidoglycan-binding domain-containing protein [Neisseria sp. Ec49-e6-T10]|uniref:LysM peptidoglycan-binding domain-containing protein n=1 Tax=Neisseria sp. Ec49-e6-T10 TaxID=3140744 RepID=UPI003EBB7803
MNKLKLISYAIAGLVIPSFSALTFAAPSAQQTDPGRAALELMQLNASPLKSGKNQYAGGDIWARTRSGFQMSEVNPELVRKHEQYYASRAAYFNRTLTRGSKYMHFILNEVQRRNMPTEIALLPVIESAFVTQAKSHVGASGLWQFMPATGTHYGLEQTWWYDGRRDVYESTRAALDYLEYLHNMFGDWSLALASYNWGEGSVSRAVKRAQAAGLEPIYENLKMPNETRNYVPKLLAVRNIINNPQAYGLDLKPLADKPYFSTVSVDQHMDTTLAAQLAEISQEEFDSLNPAFNLPVYAHKDGRNMLLPVDKVATFKRNLRKWGNKPLLSWDIYTVQGNESIAQLANDAGMNLAEFKKINGIKGNALQRGRPLLLASNNKVPTNNFNNTYTAQNEDVILVSEVAPINTATTSTARKTIVIEEPAKLVALANNQPIKAQNNVATLVQEPPVQVAKNDVIVINEVYTLSDPKPVTTTEAIPTAQNQAAPTKNEDQLQAFVDSLATQEDAKASDARVNEAMNQWKKEAEQEREIKPIVTTANNTKAVSTHKVEKGDTLTAIARQYNMTVNDLVALNNLSDNQIQAGKVLKVSGERVANNAKQSASSKERMYVVQKGDSWYSIAQKFGVKHQDIIKWNTQNASGTLKPGQQVKLVGL